MPSLPAALPSVVLLSASVGVASALVASVFISLPEPTRRRVIPHLVSFATGALLGAALFGLIPAAVESAGLGATRSIGASVIAAVLVFFLLEKWMLWRHCHEPSEPHHHDGSHAHRVAGPLLLMGEALHNVLDGVVIAAAYQTRPELGVATALAVFSHELPQEIGNIAILLAGGMPRVRALMLNLLSSLAAILGAAFATIAMDGVARLLPYALALAGGSLLYVAMADLIPGLHRQADPRRGVVQFALILAGLALILLTQHAG
jgi:zinc and cadmium transporter